MQQPATILARGTLIRTHAELEDSRGFLVVPKHLRARRPDAPGIIDEVVPGHGGDVYWVQHEGVADHAVYCFSEFELEGAGRPDAVAAVLSELESASRKFPNFHSGHEGWAVIQEELDELFDEIKANGPPERHAHEAIQVAAMAIRYLRDLLGYEVPQ